MTVRAGRRFCRRGCRRAPGAGAAPSDGAFAAFEGAQRAAEDKDYASADGCDHEKILDDMRHGQPCPPRRILCENVRADLEDDQAHDICQRIHVDEHEDRPAPATGFAADHGKGAHALHCQHKPD